MMKISINLHKLQTQCQKEILEDSRKITSIVFVELIETGDIAQFPMRFSLNLTFSIA